MNEARARALALRQGRLLERSEALRRELAAGARPWQQALGRVDAARAVTTSAIGWLRAHPGALAAGVLAFALLRPRRALGFAWRWGRRGWFAWRVWRRYGLRTFGQNPPRRPR
jgi:hypothetical protein